MVAPAAMRELRRAAERGRSEHGWLSSRHSFSFAGYHDPAQMGFGPLRVLNDDRVAPGSGFGTHSHADMEIISYVLDGTLEHQDSLGNGSLIRPGHVQRMSAGRGVSHSEFNPSREQPVHFLQIWLLPDALGIAPEYEQIEVDAARKRGRLALIASPAAVAGAVRLHQDACIHVGCFDGSERARLELSPARRCYVHLARGELQVAGERLQAGDGLKLSGLGQLDIEHGVAAEVLVFDLP
jgi:quercetin 2,3-dioxygenase